MSKVNDRRLLIVHRAQFGYHTDVYKWCEYLKDDYRVSTITFDDRKPKVIIDGVENYYVSCVRNRLVRGVCFIICSFLRILFFNGKIIICYFPKCQVLGRVFNKKRIAVDFRTMSVMPDESVRQRENAAMKAAALSYHHVIAISEGVARQLSTDISRVSIVSLGADVLCKSNKSFDQIHLLYVGTLEFRHIEKTITGLKMAIDAGLNRQHVTYDIVGDGRHGEADHLRSMLSAMGLESLVKLHGYIQHCELKEFYEKCNVGVSFVPIIDCFEFQPVTKTFEYGLSGLYTIATRTFSNQQVIKDENGILIDDTSEAFSHALLRIAEMSNDIHSSEIRSSMQGYTWKIIVDNQLKPALDKL